VTIEYILLLIMGGVIFMSVLIQGPKTAYEKGGVHLAARIETQIATGSGFQPYPGQGDNGKVPWIDKE